jgi:pimeloyl-ACP methyl ester carboxylesterase
VISRPAVRYARSGDVHIAYQILGDGPVDLLFVPWWWNHLETQWDEPSVARFLNRLASFSRLIVFDQRGTGLSDPISVNAVPTLEEWMDDLRAVIDAAQSERAAVFGHGDGAAVSILFAATYPDRTSSLVLAESYARVEWDDAFLTFTGSETPATREECIEIALREIASKWGTGVFLPELAPDRADDEGFRAQIARLERLSVSPGVAVAIQRMILEVDLRPVLPTISTPTLVVHRKDNAYCPAGWGRAVADGIPGARYVELPGAEHLYWMGAADDLLDEVELFVTGRAGVSQIERVLTTVLFTDIVGSTERAAQIGDRAWRDLLDQFRVSVRSSLDRFRGREVGTRGDDFLATFDGPARAIRCALAIATGAHALGIEVRTGLHTGEVELMDGDLGGIAVHIGARVAAAAGAGEVMVSSTVKDLVMGSGIEFEARGEHQLKGVPGAWTLHAVKT